jgi:hypothetical protein
VKARSASPRRLRGSRAATSDRMKPASSDRRPIHHSPIFWIGIALCLAAIAIYLWSDDFAATGADPMMKN